MEECKESDAGENAESDVIIRLVSNNGGALRKRQPVLDEITRAKGPVNNEVGVKGRDLWIEQLS